MTYRKTLGRLTVEVTDDGGRLYDNFEGCRLSCVSGWNESCPTITFTMSVEELRDLRYLLDRAVATAEVSLAQWRKS